MKSENLAGKTARTLKWNTLDRVASQIIYAVVGIVLANLLSKEDFGLVGALLVFQAFGNIFVDSGFGSALLQKKEPTDRDYTTVFWFNIGVSLTIYLILFFAAPLIADIFQGDRRLIPLSRVMFLTFVVNATAMVHTTRLMKEMEVKQVAIANSIGLIAGGVVGVVMALRGFGAWALVWQTLTSNAFKSAWLWIKGHWHPVGGFSMDSLRSFWRVGVSVFSSSALNTFFQYIYSFVIGAFYSLTSLGLYTQADKWSKMGSASISQVLTASFVPLLSKFQDDLAVFRSYISRINRFASLMAFPALVGLATIGTPMFHTLFGTKWDAAIILFQILAVRGVFIVLVSLYSNYLLALGYGKRLFAVEVVKDLMTMAAILITVWFGSVPLLVWGQFGASALTWVIVLVMTSRGTGVRIRTMIADLLPAGLITIIMVIGLWLIMQIDLAAWLTLVLCGLLIGAFGLSALRYIKKQVRLR
ncbi:MAG: lipopolysaccharide biosynthesis protein [Muribaculaceae bacterium]|nr:lipopolysaccharide biosynthesis protein [Muribaculaceae bacterium]